jgi:hypothetical protein
VRAFFDALDAMPADQFYLALAAFLLVLGLVERAHRMRGAQ